MSEYILQTLFTTIIFIGIKKLIIQNKNDAERKMITIFYYYSYRDEPKKL